MWMTQHVDARSCAWHISGNNIIVLMIEWWWGDLAHWCCWHIGWIIHVMYVIQYVFHITCERLIEWHTSRECWHIGWFSCDVKDIWNDIHHVNVDISGDSHVMWKTYEMTYITSRECQISVYDRLVREWLAMLVLITWWMTYHVDDILVPMNRLVLWGGYGY